MSVNNVEPTIESMDQFLNNISNDDLRYRLSNEFNFDCGPITASTRGVYIKKFKQLVDERQNNSNNNEERHQNNGNTGSNDNIEEPEITVRPSAIRLSPQRPRSSPRRAVDTELPSLPAKTSTPKSRRQSSMTVSANKKSTLSAKSRKTLAAMSEPLVMVTPLEAPVGTHINSHSSSLNNYSSESSENEDKVDDKLLSKIRKSPRKKPSPLPPTPRPLQEQMSASQRVPFARPYPPSYKPMTSSPKPSNISSLTRPPLRSPLITGQSSTKLANYSDSDDTEQEQSNNYIRDRLLRHRPGLRIGSFMTKAAPNANGTGYEDTNYSSASNFISFAILVIVVLFFVFIFSFYFYTRISSAPKEVIDLTNFAFINGEELVAPICPPSEDEFSSSSDKCLKYKSDIMPALTIANEIKTFVDKSILKFYCGSNQEITSFSDFKSIDIKDIKKAVKTATHVVKEGREGFKVESVGDDAIFIRDFFNAILLIQLNPNWQLNVVEDNIEEAVAIAISDVYPLNLPFSCQTILTLKMNSYKILSAFLVIFLTIGSIFFYKRSKKLATEEQDLIYDLVEKSLELLQSPDNPQSMPVLHIRDTLLSPSERKTSKYKKIWNKVVKHIESTESRVKVELENIEGDDYKTWKWVAVNSANIDDQNMAGTTIIRTGGIEWQGQAFNNDHNVSQSVLNANNGGPLPKPIFAAPTLFLKIRNMFDEETKLSNPKEWKNNIRSAVLEKISIASKNGSHGVVHLEVEDSPEGLVYLKCNSIDSATDAFNGLHGWWCQKKLVSVKFLKPERYHQRFPASVGTTAPLTSQ